MASTSSFSRVFVLLDKSEYNFLVIKPFLSLSEKGISIVNKTESSDFIPVIDLIKIYTYKFYKLHKVQQQLYLSIILGKHHRWGLTY